MNNLDNKQIKEFFEIMSKTRKLMFEMHSSSSHSKSSTALQLRGLMLIGQNPGCTVGELANKVMMSSASIAQYLNRLIKQNLIERRGDSKDKRINRIFLTKSGAVELKKCKEVFFDKTAELLAPLSKDELNSLIAIHKKLLVNLEEKYASTTQK